MSNDVRNKQVPRSRYALLSGRQIGCRPEPKARDLLFAVAAALLLAPAISAQNQAVIPVQAGITLERDTATVGDVIRLTVRIRAPLGASINFPAAVDSLGPVQSLAPPTVRDGPDTASFADRIATYRVAPWDVGIQPIKLGDVLVQTDDGDRRITLQPPPLFVKSVLPADSALRVPKPARPLLEVRAPTPWWWWALAAAAAAILGLFAWWWARRRRRGVADTGDPYLDAIAAFDRVDALGLIAAGEPGRHAALMADVLRRYLSQRIESVSLAHTTSELLDALRGAPSLSYEAVRSLLASVDPVKFAAAALSPDAARSIGASARELVRAEHEYAKAAATAAGQERAA